MKDFFLLVIILISTIYAQVLFSTSPEISQSTWKVPISIEANLNKSLVAKYSGQLFDIDHPNEHYIWHSYNRDPGITYVNTESYVGFDNNVLSAVFGRKYNPVGHGKMSGLFISPMAPSLDQMTFALNNFHGINYRHTIVRLDNRFKEVDGVKNVVNRWYYLNQIGYNYKNIIEINFMDAVIATGYNRGLEWYYANPLVSLFMERKHELIRWEGSDTTAVDLGDNDNHFVGGDWKVKLKNYTFYGEWLIDEWQLTTDSRDSVQTIFGVMAGLGYMKEKWEINFEYSIASPWLYLNRALYGSLEKHGQPLGLRSPQSHCIDLSVKYNINNSKSISALSHFEQRGGQNFDTLAHAWDNILPIYDFKEALPVELRLIYYDKNGKYVKRIGVFHNWLQSSSTYLIFGWDWNYNLE